MTTEPRLNIAIPNENWELALGFTNGEFRILKAAVPRAGKNYSFLAFPDKFKAFSFNADGLTWNAGGGLNCEYLYSKSIPIASDKLTGHCLRLGYMNRAPTDQHKTHHVYDVHIFPFDVETPFSLGESIGGGHAEMGGSSSYSLNKLLSLQSWKLHFEMSGCAWAIAIIESKLAWKDRLTALVEGAKACNGVSGT